MSRILVLAGLALSVAFPLAGCGGCEVNDKKDNVSPAYPEEDDRCDPTKQRVCLGGSVVACEQGRLGRRMRTCKDGCKDGRCVAVCPEGNELIYVVDSANNLLSFDPRKLPDDPFHLVGQLRCPAAGSPFSMGVDRHGNAWVLYSDGELFKVSIADATCEAAPWQGGGLGMFGMGYVLDGPGAKTEKLYVATNGARTLAAIDTDAPSPQAKVLGQVTAPSNQSPELTGTAEGKLFGFFPSAPAFVQEINRTSGDPVGPKWNLGDASFSTVSAWAFAHWGGVFYIFVTADDGLGSTVRAVRRSTGDYKLVMENLPYRITGAGVSTCAPEKDSGNGP